jgi:virginiamycin B lyase
VHRHPFGIPAPDGSFTECVVPGAGSAPNFLTAGPDGNVWFTEYYGNQIGRITLSGVITEFDIPTAGASPEGIVVGPDGNLWFSESNKIGRINP